MESTVQEGVSTRGHPSWNCWTLVLDAQLPRQLGGGVVGGGWEVHVLGEHLLPGLQVPENNSNTTIYCAPVLCK